MTILWSFNYLARPKCIQISFVWSWLYNKYGDCCLVLILHIFENLWHFDGFKVWKSVNPPAGHKCPKTQKYQKMKWLNVVSTIMFDVMTILDFRFEVKIPSQMYLLVWNYPKLCKLKLKHPCEACVGPTMEFPPIPKIMGILIRVCSIRIPSLIFDERSKNGLDRTS